MARIMQVRIIRIVENMSCLERPDHGCQIEVSGLGAGEAIARALGAPLDPELVHACDPAKVNSYLEQVFEPLAVAASLLVGEVQCRRKA